MSTDLSIIDKSLRSIKADPKLLSLLKDLHTQALTEEAYISTDSQPIAAALDKFVALDPDKCALVYLLLRASGATNVIEAGTSFGVSTIYLSLAVGQNVAAAAAAAKRNAGGQIDSDNQGTISPGGTHQGKVIATENETTKASRARQHWASAGPEIEKHIDLREGDLRSTLATNLPESIDFVLLDIWTPLALPTLQLVVDRLRVGAMVVADNTIAAASGYRELDEFLDDPVNGFRNLTAPYPGGLGVSVFVGRE